ncbi:MAG: ZIP family metal transporter [Aigarchaeota archaeon]|nr:ZIP family metal transporter [Candidatus Geocrenenecus dongiae]
MIGDLFTTYFGWNPALHALIGGLITSLLNLLGATPILFIKRYPRIMIYSGLGFAAGVMLAASFTSLILPGLEYGGLLPVIVGIFLGAFTVSLIDKILPHLHIIKGREGPSSKNLKAAWLFVIAITIHNMPEGFAVGVGFGSGDIASAIALALAIGFQNIPEGLSVGFSLISVNNYSRLKAYIISTLSGFVEAPLAILGAYLTSLSLMLLPYFMGFAAGAMIFVVSDEIIPETHSEGKERVATYSLIIGLVLMLTLDIFLS